MKSLEGSTRRPQFCFPRRAARCGGPRGSAPPGRKREPLSLREQQQSRRADPPAEAFPPHHQPCKRSRSRSRQNRASKRPQVRWSTSGAQPSNREPLASRHLSKNCQQTDALAPVVRRLRRIRAGGTEVGKRSRQRSRAEDRVRTAPAARDRMARVQVDRETWREFRAVAGGRPISELLGELVEREVRRARSARLRDGTLTDRELVDAFAMHATRRRTRPSLRARWRS